MDDRLGERDLLEMLDEVRQERDKAEHRLVGARRALDAVNEKYAALQIVLSLYRTKHGIPVPVSESVDPQEVARYRGIGTKDIIRRWADTHNGQIVIDEAGEFLAAAGFFDEKKHATGTLSPTMSRLVKIGEFERISRGTYRQRTSPRESPEQRAQFSNPTSGGEHDRLVANGNGGAYRPLLRAVTAHRDETTDSDDPFQ